MRRRVRIRASDLIFRFGTGTFALILVAIVVGIGIVLWRESTMSIRTFGWKFWATSTWDPVAGQFGAFPFIWGTIYSSILALLISTPIAVGIAVFLSDLC